MRIINLELAGIQRLSSYVISVKDRYQVRLMFLYLQNLNDFFAVFNVELLIRKSIGEELNHLLNDMKNKCCIRSEYSVCY
jgi:hypothetical protein